MALDDGARAANAHALDDVGVERALYEVFGVFDLLRLGVEDLDEHAADDFSLLLGVGHATLGIQEATTRVDGDQIEVKTALHHAHDGLELVFAQEAIVHEDADQSVAQRLVAEHGRYRGVDATGESTDGPLIFPHLGGDPGDGLVDEGAGGEVGGELSHLEQERANDFRAARRVGHFGMELDAVEAARWIRDSGERSAGAGPDALEASGQGSEAVAVAHPDLDLLACGKGGEDADRLLDGQLRAAVFSLGIGFHLATQLVGHQLLAVADAEHRQAELQDLGVAL